MPNSTLDLESFRADVETRLGGLGVDVELEQGDYLQCLKDTLRLFNRSRPQRATVSLTVNATTKKYGPFNTLYKGFVGVVNVEFVQANMVTGQVDPFNPLSTIGGPNNITGDGLGALELSLQNMEMGRRMLSAEPEYRTSWERDGNFYLYVDVPSGVPYNCSLEYTWHITPDEDLQTGLKWIPDGDLDWIINFAVAKAKQILGRKRGKFQGITNPDGSVDPVDYQELLEEGKQEETDLKAEIEARRRPLIPVIE